MLEWNLIVLDCLRRGVMVNDVCMDGSGFCLWYAG